MTTDWRVLVHAAGEYWESLAPLKQVLHAGSGLLVVAFLLLLWTPAGNRRAAFKCLALAVLLHALAWGFFDQYDFRRDRSGSQASEFRISLRLRSRSRENRAAASKLVDELRGDRSALAEESIERRRKPEPAIEPTRPTPTDPEPAPEVLPTPALPEPREAATPTDPTLERIRPVAVAAPKPAPKADPNPVATAREAPVESLRRRRTAEAPRARVRPPRKDRSSEAPDATPRLVGRRSPDPLTPSPTRTGVRSTRPAPAPAPAKSAGSVARNDRSAKDVERAASSEGATGRLEPANGKRAADGAGGARAGPLEGLDGIGMRRRRSGSTGTPVRRQTGKRTPVRRQTGKRTAGGDGVDLETLLARGRSSPAAAEASTEAVAPAGLWGNRLAPNRLDILQRHGGSQATERAVVDALAWLATHQDQRGFWDSDGFARRCPAGDRCEGVAVETGSDTGLTGLALLAFLGAGHTDRPTDEHGQVVRRGVDWLVEVQRSDGDLRGRGRIYCHAMATIALCEAYALTEDQRLKRPAQRAIDWLAQAQHPRTGGWRYAPGQLGDTSVFGWAVLALRSAEAAGLRVSDETWRRTRRWPPLVTSGPHGGLAAYRPGSPPSHSMTAETLLCRQVFGMARDADAAIEAGNHLLNRLPEIDDYHLYYWYYGTLSMFQLGGNHWQRWNDRLKVTLLATQEKTGHRRGSWTPKRPFGIDGGRIFSTACSALCLEVYYRYLPNYATSGATDR